MSREQYSKKFFPQSLYRKPLADGIKKYDQLELLQIELPNFENLNPSLKSRFIQRVEKLVQQVITALLPSYDASDFLDKVLNRLGLKNSPVGSDSLAPSQIWNQIEKPLLNNLKTHLLENQSSQILKHFDKKTRYLVQNYSRYLPKYISDIEKDDLLSIAQIELLETVKAWVPIKNSDIWPLAHSRINGAMKDYIRFISKSDPARMFEFINDSAVVYTHFKQEENPNIKIETGYELARAMECLDEREHKIILAYIQEDKTFSNISKELGLSESQISRIYKKIITKLQNVLKK